MGISLARDAAVPLLVWGAATVVAHAAGCTMSIPWVYFQLLDADVLAAHPVRSLCYLHSQPPLLNALAAAVLWTASTLGAAPETIATILFRGIGASGAVVVHHLTRRLTGSVRLAALAVVVVVADPAYHLFANLFFYEFLLQLLLLLLVGTAVRYLDTGRASLVGAVVSLLAAIALTRSLFHPLWAIGFFVLVVGLRMRLGAQRWDVVAAGALVLVALLAAWPAKNAYVYGQFRMASLSAFSLAHGLPECGADLVQQALDTKGREATIALLDRASRICGHAASDALRAPVEGNGLVNMNSFVQLIAAPDRERCGIAWRTRNVGEWLRRAAGYYAMWMRPAFVESYWGTLQGPESAGWIAYASAWQHTVFVDLRPGVESALPTLTLHRYAAINERPVPYTLYGFVAFPILVLGLAIRGIRRRNARDGAVAWLLLATILCPMVAACLTDGAEGNRMRFSTMPLVVVAALFAVHPRRER